MYQRRLTVYKRNEKYKFQGHHALQSNNPYIVCNEERIEKNLRDLSIKTEQLLNDMESNTKGASLVPRNTSAKPTHR